MSWGQVLLKDTLIFGMLFGLSAFFSASETAFMAINRLKLKIQAKADQKAALTQAILQDTESFLGTILICNNIVNVTLSSLATSLAITVFGDRGVFYATGVVTLSLLIFGEIVPKSIASYYPYKFSITVSPIIKFLIRFFGPFLTTIKFISRNIIALLKIKQSENTISISEEELELLIESENGNSFISKEKQDMLLGILLLDKAVLRDIMIPWRDVAAINIDSSFQEIFELIKKTNFSRYPVYEGDPTNVVGFVHVRDLFIRDKSKDFSLLKIMRSPSFAPDLRSIKHQLELFKRERTHMTFIVDEYGNVVGLVTLEDILEEIVGDIEDEHDLRRKNLMELNDGSFLADGSMLIRDVNRQLDITLPEEDVRTLGGLIFNRLQRFPEIGETVAIGRYRFQVIRKLGHRIDKVRLWK